MDPVTTAILAALSAGAIGGITEMSKTAITDTYQKLKGLLTNKFGPTSKVVRAVDALEEEHDSKGRQLTLQEQIAQVKADQDQELLQVAQSLLHEVRSQPGGERSIQSIMGNYNAQVYGNRLPIAGALPPASRLPAFARNPSFVGRETELARIAEVLKARNLATMVITGLGGVGKSQLVSEFVYRYGQYFAGGVFWLSFSNADAVLAEVAVCTIALSQELRLDVRTLPVDEQVHLVLSTWQNPFPRLLIFDNCEEERLLARWRPHMGGCRILITSRRGNWHPDLGVSVIPLDVLPRAQSVELLGTYRSDLSVRDRELVAQELGDLPLALSMAGSYLHTYRESRLGAAKQYLLALRRVSPLEHSSLQQEGSTFTTGHTEHVARTFALSYEQLNPSETIDATALQLLAHVACFAPGEPIPRDLLSMTMGSEEDEDAEDRFVQALKRVHALGLLHTQQEGAQQMHRLLMTFVQKRLRSTEAIMEAQLAVEEAVLRRTEEANKAGYPVPLLRLQEHLHTITARASERGDVMAADLNAALGEHLRMIAAYQEAQRYLERSLRIYEQSLGSEHPQVAFSRNRLANLYYEQGRYVEAEPLYQRALAIYEQSLGPEHPDVTFSLNRLANLYYEQSRYAEAEPLFQRALRLSEKSLGPEHPEAAYSLNGLANVYYEQSRYAEAEPLYRQALAIYEQSLGPEHPDVAWPIHNLADLYREWGNYVEAESLYQRSLRIWEQSLGSEHPQVAFALTGLARLYYKQGRYTEAKPLFQRALYIREQGLRPEHPHTQTVRANYASLLREMGLNTQQHG
jgi:tetratricopeptide (TPR) repeat protein